MAAAIETMFYVRETPWHGLGIRVEESLKSEDALRIAGLDWRVEQKICIYRWRSTHPQLQGQRPRFGRS